MHGLDLGPVQRLLKRAGDQKDTRISAQSSSDSRRFTETMPAAVYFDSDVFHRIAQIFHEKGLSADMRNRIVLSPITALEVLSTLTLQRADEMLQQIHSLRNWLNREHVGILPWPGTAIALYGFGVPYDDGNFTERLARSLALLHDSTAARVGALFQLLVQDTTAQDFGLPSSAIRLRM